MPCVYFNYHIGGIKVEVYPKRNMAFRFLFNLCAVIGGIYALANFLSTSVKSLSDKHGYELIKWSEFYYWCWLFLLYDECWGAYNICDIWKEWTRSSNRYRLSIWKHSRTRRKKRRKIKKSRRKRSRSNLKFRRKMIKNTRNYSKGLLRRSSKIILIWLKTLRLY